MAEALSEMILFIVGIAIAVSVVGTVVVSVERTNNAMSDTSSQLYSRMSSKIKIINDPLRMSGSPSDPLVVYIQNIGKTTLSTDVVLMVDGAPRPGRIYLLKGDEWVPSSLLCIEIEYPRLPAGEHSVAVIAENGITDSMSFKV
jgi:archaellum component FlaG (FlaF/FlaG flagellin family)